MKIIFLEVFNFIKSPNDIRIENWTLKKNIKYILHILVIELLITISIIIPLLILLNKVEPLLYEARIDYKNNTLIKNLLIIAIIVPIFEELIFRYLLRYNKIFSKLISRRNWNFLFKYLVYLSIILFGFIHSSNYENNSIFFYCILPIIVSTQLIGGIFLTFLRVRFNLLSSIISHLIWNTIAILIPLAISIFEKPYEKKTKNYTVKIQNLNYNTNKPQKFEIDSNANKIFKINIEEYSINHILDSLYKYNRESDDVLLNIKLNSKEGVTKEEFKTIVLEYDKNELQ